MSAELRISDPDAEKKVEILDWIEAVLGEKVPRDQPFEKVLKDGVILCNLANKIEAGSVKKINKKGGNFALMENVAAFQKAMKKIGVPEEEIFQTVDLFEARNIKSVVKGLIALGRTLQDKGWDGPTLGPKMSHGEKREFDAAELQAGRQGIIGLQAGSNKGATAAGVSMGRRRMIND